MLLHGASDLDQRCLKTRAILRTDLLLNQKFGHYPQNPPKTPFWGPFNAKPIIERALRKLHVNGATQLKLYSYISIGKYLGRVQIFPLGGVREAQGPLMQIWDPLLVRKLLKLES